MQKVSMFCHREPLLGSIESLIRKAGMGAHLSDPGLIRAERSASLRKNFKRGRASRIFKGIRFSRVACGSCCVDRIAVCNCPILQTKGRQHSAES